jgi:hypothetical protein
MYHDLAFFHACMHTTTTTTAATTTTTYYTYYMHCSAAQPPQSENFPFRSPVMTMSLAAPRPPYITYITYCCLHAIPTEGCNPFIFTKRLCDVSRCQAATVFPRARLQISAKNPSATPSAPKENVGALSTLEKG